MNFRQLPGILASFLLLLSISGCVSLETSRVTISPNGHNSAISQLIPISDGNRVLSVSTDRTIRIWDTRNGNLLNTIYTNHGPFPNTGDLYAASLTFNGRVLAVAGRGLGKSAGSHNYIRLIDLETNRLISIVKGKGSYKHLHPIKHLTFSPDGLRMISVDENGKIIVWKAETSSPISFAYLTSNIYEIKFTPSSLAEKIPWEKVNHINNSKGLNALFFSTNKGLYGYSWEDENIKLMSFGREEIFASSARPDSVVLYSKNDSCLYAWKSPPPFLSEQKISKLNSTSHLLFFREDGSKYFIASEQFCDNLIVDSDSGTIDARFEPFIHQARITAGTFLDSNSIALGDQNGTICIWDAKTGELSQKLGPDTYPIRTVKWDKDNSIRFGACFGEGNVDPCESEFWKTSFPIHPTPYKFSLNKFSLQEVEPTEERRSGPATFGFKYKAPDILEPNCFPEYSIKIDSMDIYTSVPLVSSNKEAYVPHASGFTVYSKGRTKKLKKIVFRGNTPIKKINIYKEIFSEIFSIAESSDQNFILTGGMDRVIRILDSESLKIVASIYFDQSGSWICWTPDSYYFQGSISGSVLPSQDLRKQVITVNNLDEESLPRVSSLADLSEDKNDKEIILRRLGISQ